MIQARNISLGTFITNPKFIQSGGKAVWAYHSNSTGGQETITFNTPFDNVPIVLVTGMVFNVYGVTVNTSEITRTGFKISARHTGATGDPISVGARWVAIDVSKLSITD